MENLVNEGFDAMENIADLASDIFAGLAFLFLGIVFAPLGFISKLIKKGGRK